MGGLRMNYQEWEQNVPVYFTGDPLWTVEAYRLGLFVADNCTKHKISQVTDYHALRITDHGA
jgi:hypothetical protein